MQFTYIVDVFLSAPPSYVAAKLSINSTFGYTNTHWSHFNCPKSGLSRSSLEFLMVVQRSSAQTNTLEAVNKLKISLLTHSSIPSCS